MALVSLVRCSGYNPDRLKAAVEKSLCLIGYEPADFRGARVAVKPNLLTVAGDDSGVITHPEFFRAAIRIIKENGGTPVLVESPAVHSVRRVIKKTGYAAVVEEEGVSVANPAATKTLYFEDAQQFKHMNIAAAFFDADMILALPKFKTHAITYISGAVKLLFGAVPGMEKSKMHLRLPRHADFADFLLDLYGAMTCGMDPAKPLLHVMDAITALEGEGPGPAGRPRRMNTVIAGRDGVAVDWTAARVAGLDISRAPTITRGWERGYGASRPEDIQIAGEDLKSLQIQNFLPARGNAFFPETLCWPMNTQMFRNLFVERPVSDPELCTGCFQCRAICPAGAIRFPGGKAPRPSYDYAECIRCYCCHEICPEGAIEKRRGRLQWLLEAIGG